MDVWQIVLVGLAVWLVAALVTTVVVTALLRRERTFLVRREAERSEAEAVLVAVG